MKEKNEWAAEKMTLITNVSFVQIGYKGEGNYRLDAHAVLIEENFKSMFSNDKKESRIRGFGTDGAWTVFTHYNIKLPWKLSEEGNSRNQIAFLDSKTNDLKPLFTGHTLTLGDGKILYLNIENTAFAMDVKEFDDILDVWRVLPEKVSYYWQAPNIPSIIWGPARREWMTTHGR